MTEEKTWPEPGDAAVVIVKGYSTKQVIETTVLRVGKRDVVCESGDRFNKASLQRREGDVWHGTTIHLVKPDDPEVAVVRRQIAREEWESEVRGCANVIADTARRRAEGWQKVLRSSAEELVDLMAEEVRLEGE